jgi:hypothetical protein
MLLGVIPEIKEAAAGLAAGITFETDGFTAHSDFFFLEDWADQGNPVGGEGGPPRLAC